MSKLARLAPIVCLTTLLGAQPFAESLYGGLRWRLVGPFRGGRAIAACGVQGDPNTFYFGAVGGGVWKTTDAGLVWTPIFDGQPTASIGAIEVAPSSPNVIYVGTGEADIRSDLASGDGVYKSTDSGKTWRNIGLRDSRQIGRIVIDPKNPDVVFVAALGHAYGPNAERGVFRSTDGGQTWRKVLDKGPDVGAVDLAMEPENPKVLYATMWRARRPPFSQYGPLEGPGSGLYKSTDGGDTWAQLSGNGLPETEWGRVGIAVARGSRGRRVYALIESKNTGFLYRSDDAGKSWTRATSDARIDSRAWYFSSLTVDPSNPDIVYAPNVALFRSVDGGKTFTVLKGAPGGDDYHYLWIDPTNSARMILASDQGTSISVDGGATWTSWYNQATAQMYHVVTDNRFPYFVYGSQQDSGTAVVASRTDHGEILEAERMSVGGAESGYIAPDPKDPKIVYVGDTLGSLTRFDKRNSQGQNVTPWPLPAFGTEIVQRKYRNTWTSPLVFSPLEPNTLYFGTQYVLKTTDGGLHWQENSPDLTGAAKRQGLADEEEVPPTIGNAKARGYVVVYSIAPSPLRVGLLWAGTDSGLLHLTRDGGKTWSNVTPPGLGDWSKITAIEASHFDPAVAYAAVDRHRLDDQKPYLYRTSDYGKTWTLVADGIGEHSFLNAIREDPTRKGLLFAATETGVSVSFDDGDHWQSLQLNLPAVSARDLAVHGDDLVVATHGRSFWILDDIAPLREIGAKVASADAWLYKPATAIRTLSEDFQGTPFPPEIPKAQNPPDGAMIDYYLAAASSDEVTLEILGARNQLVRRYSTKDVPAAIGGRSGLMIADIWIAKPARLTADAGLNRFVWDLRYAAPPAVGGGEGGEGGPARGPQALPGVYQVRLTVNGHSYTQPLRVKLDPRSSATPMDLAHQLDLGLKTSAELRRNAELAAKVGSVRRQLADLKKSASDSSITALITSVDVAAAKIPGTAGASLTAVLEVVESGDRSPPAQAYALFEEARKALSEQAAQWNALKTGKLAELNKALREHNLAEVDESKQ
jgi:photosystem II stability/assembly factor-like uncharacterized protein